MAKLWFRMFKVDRLKAMRAMLETIKLQEQGLTIQLEMQGQINQGVKDFKWFKDKMLLAQAQEAGVALNEEQQDFLADSLEETDDYKDHQLQATTNFKAEHVDAYDSDCDDEATTNAIFMENLSPVGSLNNDTVLRASKPFSPATTHTELMARVNKLLKMRQSIDSLLSKTMNELTNQSSDSETFCPRERIKNLELRTQRRNNFEEELFKEMFPIEEELAYHKELRVNSIILEDLGSVIDGRLSEVVLGKPIVQASKLTYDESLGLIRFAYKDDEVVFRMP
ncbi:hypothetical protein Tco_1148919 [Tanacetum coccineum]